MTIQDEEVVKAEEQEDAAFLAEMKAEEQVDAEAPAPQVDVEVKDEEPVVERKEIIQGFTEDEIRAALEQLPKLQKALDTTNGTLGSRLADQQRALDEFKSQRIGKLTPDKMKRLNEQYPDLVELLVADLNDVVGLDGEQPNVDVKALVAAEYAVKEAEMERKLEIKALDKQHADWKEIAMFGVDDNNVITWNNPVFGKWVESQTPEVKNKLVSVWDAEFVGKQLDAFKAATKPKSVSKEILEKSLLPRGSGKIVSKSELDEEEAAYRAEMARR